MYFDYIYGFGCIYIISVTADPLAPAKLIICSVFDVPALSEVMKVRGGKKRGEETRRERTESRRTIYLLSYYQKCYYMNTSLNLKWASAGDAKRLQ